MISRRLKWRELQVGIGGIALSLANFRFSRFLAYWASSRSKCGDFGIVKEWSTSTRKIVFLFGVRSSIRAKKKRNLLWRDFRFWLWHQRFLFMFCFLFVMFCFSQVAQKFCPLTLGDSDYTSLFLWSFRYPCTHAVKEFTDVGRSKNAVQSYRNPRRNGFVGEYQQRKVVRQSQRLWILPAGAHLSFL